MKKLKLFLILFSFIINSLFAMDNYTHTQNIPENIYHRGEDGFNINASYIFWQPKEAGTELALMFTDTLYSDIACDSVIYFDESYKSGFKVGAGYFMPYDDWELNAEYLWFHNSHHKSYIVNSSEYLLPTWGEILNVIDPAYNCKGKWTLIMDMGRLDITHPIYVGKKLLIDINCGIKGGRIDQKHYTYYNLISGDYEQSNWKSDSWLIGPKLAIFSKWMMSTSFFISANFSSSLFYQKFDVKGNQKGTDTFLESVKILISQKYSTLNPSIEFLLGLGYTKSFCNNAYNFMIKAGYDFVTYFNQNMMRHYRDLAHLNVLYQQGVSVNTTFHSIGNLNMHGLTVKAQFDF